jgi:cytochrome c551/c552
MKFAGAVFAAIFLAFTFSILKDQVALSNALTEHNGIIIEAADKLEAQKKSTGVTKETAVNAEEIYKSKCIACHKFDQKVIGPPYQQTVPKYNGDIKQLSAFIYNPVKKNPDYPAMPNQGLKQKEAEAMAKWLIEQVGGKK